MEGLIPYITEAREDTGLTNGKIGIWLFLASEVMLFGAFFATYIVMRLGADVWPHGWEAQNVPMGTVNTIVLISSSVTMVMAWASLERGDLGKFQLYIAATVGFGFVFLIIKYFEYTHHIHEGMLPSTNTYLATYFTMTGLHGLHVIFGMVANAYFGIMGRSYWDAGDRVLLANRVENSGLFWHFVDLVWIFLFPVLYLL
ncbi:MAG: cytochrome c oxidase subunit 3 [Candidatus Binatia bacterium]